jgi:hypothetical protein
LQSDPLNLHEKQELHGDEGEQVLYTNLKFQISVRVLQQIPDTSVVGDDF